MSAKASASAVRLVVGLMIGASLALIGGAVWMIVRDEGSPVFVALGGSLLAALAAVIGARSPRTPRGRP